jgi:hypothetical protein
MLEVPSTWIAKQFSQYRQAAQREPVGVTHYGRVTEVERWSQASALQEQDTVLRTGACEP